MNAAQALFKHPSRYPMHKGDKGQVFGGVCNVTHCDNDTATYFNIQTRGYYCRRCAAGINFNPKEPLLCIPVKEALSGEEMDRLYNEDMQKRYAPK